MEGREIQGGFQKITFRVVTGRVGPSLRGQVKPPRQPSEVHKHTWDLQWTIENSFGTQAAF